MLTTISSTSDWSKEASVQTCKICRAGTYNEVMLSQTTADAHLLMVWHRAKIADVFKPDWYIHFEGTAKQRSRDQPFLKHVAATGHPIRRTSNCTRRSHTQLGYNTDRRGTFAMLLMGGQCSDQQVYAYRCTLSCCNFRSKASVVQCACHLAHY